MKEMLQYSQAVKAALTEGKPVLALESTVITHGLPYPQNLETARELEKTARELGVTPATIILIDGTVHIGLEESDFVCLAELTQQAQADKTLLKKLAQRDLVLAMAQKWSGGTTVSATLHLANLARIKVFATGGIGGVHRDWQESLDISADLHALANHPVIIVTAGCKAILDIPTTLEQLETLCVPVYGWQTDRCPAFYTKDSPYPIDRVDSIVSITEAYKAQAAMQRMLGGCEKGTALVVMNPIPSAYSVPSEVMEPFIRQALQEAEQLGIRGKASTPFLLQKLAVITAGESVKANLELLKNNVRLGSKIAAALAEN